MQAVVAVAMAARVAQAVAVRAAQTLQALQAQPTQVVAAEVREATILLMQAVLAVQASLFCQSLLVTTQVSLLAHPRSLQAAQTPLSNLLLVGRIQHK
jgi:hypothetical protein